MSDFLDERFRMRGSAFDLVYCVRTVPYHVQFVTVVLVFLPAVPLLAAQVSLNMFGDS